MSIVCVRSFAVSLDGFAAGLDQGLEQPLGVRGPELMEWFFNTRVWRDMHHLGGGETGVDNRMAELGFQNVGAWILGRNMFGPVRGPWPDESWRGWWGDEPPYHVPTFVLTHHSRPPLAMQGGTTFHFVTDGIAGALARAKEAAGGRDVRIVARAVHFASTVAFVGAIAFGPSSPSQRSAARLPGHLQITFAGSWHGSPGSVWA